MKCKSCGTEFQGRPNKQYCSIQCRREIEYRRREWDSRKRYLENSIKRVFWTEQQRAFFREKLDNFLATTKRP